jgi:tetratricopeptide (TPR) repeat protein
MLINAITKHLPVWLLLFMPFTTISQTAGDKARLLKEYKDLRDSSFYVDRMNELAGIYYMEGNKDSALFYLDVALAVARERNDAEGTCRIYTNMASLELYRRRIPRAMELYQEALLIAEKNKIPELQATILHNMGIVLFSEDKFEDAAVYYQRALVIDDKIKDTMGMVFNYSSLCNCFSELNDTARAKLNCYNAKLLSNALERSGSIHDLEKLKLTEIKRTLEVNIANLLLMEKKYQEVINRMTPYWNDRENIKDTVQFARVLGKLSAAYEGLGNYDQSLFFAVKAEELIGNNKTEHWDACKDYYALQGRAYAAKGLYREAFRAQQLYQQASDSFSTAEKNKRINELYTRYETEKKSSQIVTLKKERSRYRVLVLMASILAVVTAILLAFIWRSKKMQQKIHRQEKELLQNQFENELALLEQTALRAQMNPHFIFNALTSIHNMVAASNQRQTHLFINQFTRLIRQTLENSGNTFIPLKDEIRFIEVFLQLEQTRAQPAFRFEIKTMPGIDLEAMSFPAMMVQPFLENSIQHAFNEKTGKENLLTVEFLLDDGLVCTVTDNGKGVQPSALLQSASSTPGAPNGIGLVQKRIASINKIYAADIELNIEAIPALETGTYIRLRIPLALCS